MDLYICEKPSQARFGWRNESLPTSDGFLHDGETRYYVGVQYHLLELYMPDDYDERYRSHGHWDPPYCTARVMAVQRSQRVRFKQYQNC